MKNIFIILLVLASGVSLVLGGCAVSTTPVPSASPQPSAQSETTSDKYVFLTFTSGFPSEYPMEQVFREWFRKLQADSGGRLQISVLDTTGVPAQNVMAGGAGGFSSLAEERQYVDWVWCLPEGFNQAPQGLPEGSNQAPQKLPAGFTPEESMPLWQSMQYFVYGTDMKGAYKVSTQLYQEFPEIQAEFTKNDLKLVGMHAGNTAAIQTVEGKPVRTLADLKGLRIIGSMYNVPLLKEYGAVTDNLPMAIGYQVFTTNKGEVDGTINLQEFLTYMEGGEVIKYVTDLRIPYAAKDIYALKLATWNSIPPELQKVIEDSLPWFYDRMAAVQQRITQEAIDQAKARGTEFIELSSEDLDAMNLFLEQQAKEKAAELDAKGLPGTKMFERARQIVTEHNAASK